MTLLGAKMNLRLGGGLEPQRGASSPGNLCTAIDRSGIKPGMIVDQIRLQMKEAMRAKRDLEKDVLRTALGEMQTAEARAGKALSDEEAQKIVKKLIKSNQETIDVSKDDGTKAKLAEEIRILEALLPKTLSVAEIVAALQSVADDIKSAKSDGQATGVAMKKLKSEGATVDGKDVAEAVKRLRA